MEAQLNFALSQLRQLLRKRKYKATLSKLQRMLDNWEIRYYSPEMLINLLLCQTTTLNKLIQRNLLKKYKYEARLIQQLIDLLTRNLTEMHELLCQILEDRGQAAVGKVTATERPSFPLVKESEGISQIKLEKISLKNKKVASPLQRYVEDYAKLVNISTINILQTLALYKQDLPWQDFEEWFQIPPMPFVSLSGLLSQAKLQLLYAKLLSLQTKEYLPEAQKVIELTTDQLIDCLHKANIQNYLSNGLAKKQCKYTARQKECYKLLTIALIMSSKNNMKAGREEVAAMGCDLVRSLVLNLGHGFGFFKRMLQPELYLFQQFMRYRVEKKDLQAITSQYFSDFIQKQEILKEERLSIAQKDILRGQIDSKIVRPSNQNTLLEQISTVKTISIKNKRKGNSSVLTGKNSNTSSIYGNKHMSDTILTKMIVGHIEEQHQKYHDIKNSIGNNTYYKQVVQKHQKSNNIPIQKTLKKQKISQPSTLEEEEAGFCNQPKYKREGQLAKQRLQRKAKLQILQNSLQDQEQPFVQLQRQVENCKNLLLMRLSQQKSFTHEQSQIKRKVLNLGRKTKIFVDILFQNRGGLGIRKIVEKFEVLKKKEQQKQKMTSNRITSSTSRDRGHVFRNMQKFKVITEQILRMHLDSHNVNTYNIHHQVIEDRNQIKKHIESNYALGQDSIESIKLKLLQKMNGKGGVKTKSQLDQQLFKQKLKGLGSTNFFLKQVPEANRQQTTKRPSFETERKSRVSFCNWVAPLN